MGGKIKTSRGQAGVRCAGRRSPRCSLKKWQAMARGAVNKVAKAIKADLRGIDKRSAVEQMAAYFDIGRRLQEVVENENRYGTCAMREIAGLVPELKDEGRAYEIRDLSTVGEEGKAFILEQTGLPMNDGKPLTLGHWLWPLRHKDWVNPDDPADWVVGELAWFRTASPSADVLDHVEAVWARRHNRELEEVQEKVREAVGLLESV
jgi:hypothetical protein